MEPHDAHRRGDELRQRRNAPDLVIDNDTDILGHYIDRDTVSRSARPERRELLANRCSVVGRGS